MSIARMMQMAAAGVSAGGVAFSPADINDLHLWLDASDASTLFQDTSKTTSASANNDPIGCWADKSGNGFDHDQSTNAYRPYLNTSQMNLNSLSFNGSLNSNYGQWLENSTCTDNITWFAAFHLTNSGVLVGQGASINGYLLFHSGTSGQSNYMGTNAGYRNANSNITMSRNVDTICSGDMVNFIRRNGVQAPMCGPFNTTPNPFDYNGGVSADIGTYIGRRGLSPTNHQPFDGYIGEVITYDRRLSSTEIGQVESYLSKKWSITI